jgi:dTDP-4-amino-4,6-dideoxygalactose transaminase
MELGKTTKRKLAVLGGKSFFAEPLHVGRPNLGDRDRLFSRFNEMLDRNWLTNAGPFVQEFEKRVADLTGVKHCIAMCNATVALEITARALNLTGEVIIPSFTFVATAHALQWQKITPVFCDIDPQTHNINPRKIRYLITPRTSAILGVHLWGRACPIEELEAIASEHNLKLLFDAAHAFGCSYKGRMIGQFGNAEVLSFHATKFLNSGEGGAVVTNNDELAAKVRLMKNFGFSGYDNVIYIGINGKMSELSGAMGLTNLESVEQFTRTNKENFEVYENELANIPGISLLSYDKEQRPNYQYVVCDVDKSVAGLTRDQLVSALQAENVLARKYFYPGVHRMEPYRSYFPHANLLLPDTQWVAERVMVLPTGNSIAMPEIKAVCEIIREAISHATEVSRALASATSPS